MIEPQVISADQNTITEQNFQSYGVALPVQFSNRNMFKNAEIFQLTFRPSVEAQGRVSGGSFFNATQLSLSASVIVPHILFIPAWDRNVNFVNTKSIINASAIYEQNIDYARRVATIGLNYQFNKKLTSWYWSPVEFSFIRTTLVDSSLIARAETDIFLKNLFTSNVIMDGRFGFNYSNKPIARGRNFYLVRWDALEYAGNLLSVMNWALGLPKNAEGQYRLFGVNYFQYLKSAIDFRFNHVINKNSSAVYRFFSGAMYSYWNSPDFTPFEKRFYVGGANDLRAWSPRSIGPGSYAATNQIDHSGDIKIELNAEYRFNIYNLWLEGALFTDAGNIWAMKKNETTPPGADFEFNRFYNEFAIDAGFGVRLNFTIVLIRFDIGIPLHDPTYTDSNKTWVIKDFGGKWLRDDTYFNFGIGYPF